MAVSAEADIPSQFGRSAVVTGATGGLGYEMALALARSGAEVILTGRDDRKGLSAIESLLRALGREVTPLPGADIDHRPLGLRHGKRCQPGERRLLLLDSLNEFHYHGRELIAEGRGGVRV